MWRQSGDFALLAFTLIGFCKAMSSQILQCMLTSLEFLQTNYVYDFNAIVNFGGSWGIRNHSKI